MDGGIGEMALMDAITSGAATGAAVGGGSALLTGGDPLQGILRGGLMGGATGGIFNGMSGAAAATPAAGAAPVAGTEAATSNLLANAPNAGVINPMASAPDISTGGSSFDSFGSPVPQSSLSAMNADPTNMAANAQATNMAGAPPPPGTNPSWWSTLTDKQKMMTGGAGIMGLSMLSDRNKFGVPAKKPYTGPLSQFTYNPSMYRPSTYAQGGITSLGGGNIGDSTANGGNLSVGNDASQNYYPAMQDNANNWQAGSFPAQSMAAGGITSLGGYSDGGHMLKGPGDGMSDSIPATIAGHRPARLATDEFVVPADVVSHLGNGSSDAGAKQLYSMMDNVRKARTGRKSQGREINPGKYMPV
jgi:hypothetical protein